jgi:hypothetical protein
MKTKGRKAKNQAADKNQAARKEVVEELTILRPDAGGVDCGAEEPYASVPPDRVPAGQAAVRCFSAFTEGLDALVDWFKECRISTVAMESTGEPPPIWRTWSARSKTIARVSPAATGVTQKVVVFAC